MKNEDGAIWIVHASVGGGHKAAARAVARAYAEQADVEPALARRVELVDALDGMSDAFRALYTGSFEVGVGSTPTFYGALFAATKELDRSPVLRAARALGNRAHGERFVQALRAARPAAVICTHFLPLDLALRERARGRLDAPVVGVVTDHVAHGLWRQPAADLTFCPPGRARLDLRRGAVPDHKVVAAGIPIDPAFGRTYDRAASKRAAGLDPVRPTVALLAGGAGMGPLVEVLEATAGALRGAADLVVVCGKNEALRARAADAANRLPGRIRVVGFVDPIVELLRGADVVVTKPGGLTTCECLALGKATVFYEAAPGQEGANARHCEALGAARFRPAAADAAAEVARLVADPAARAALEERARRAARPDAAAAVVERVERLLATSGRLLATSGRLLATSGRLVAARRRRAAA